MQKIEQNGDGKSAVATSDRRSRKKKTRFLRWGYTKEVMRDLMTTPTFQGVVPLWGNSLSSDTVKDLEQCLGQSE